MKKRHRPIKRVTSVKLLALVFPLASVFLVGFASPAQVSAMDGNSPSALFVETAMVSPLQENQLKIDELKVEFKTKAEQIEEKQAEMDKRNQELAEAESAKRDAQAVVGDLKAQVEELKARLAEKKRLEALRIVPASRAAPGSGGNTYAPGNCTYYVKNKRPDLPNNLGNANTWAVRAAAQGYKTGSMAKTGAVGVTTAGWAGHVVYVEKWLGNGRILISEMNVGGLWNTQTREADESEFVYIYELA